MNELKIVAWNTVTFPNATAKGFLIKLKEELNEAMDDIENENYAGLDRELADIAILSISYLARIRGKSFDDVIEEKFKVVQSRTWGEENENGDRKKICVGHSL